MAAVGACDEPAAAVGNPSAVAVVMACCGLLPAGWQLTRWIGSNEGQTAKPSVGLVDWERGSRRTQMRTAQRTLLIRVSSLIGDPASIEFVRCRSDLFNRSFVVAVVLVEGVEGWLLLYAGLRLRWLGLKSSSRVNIAHRMRAFFAASATAAFCQPARSASCLAQSHTRSSRGLLRRMAALAP